MIKRSFVMALFILNAGCAVELPARKDVSVVKVQQAPCKTTTEEKALCFNQVQRAVDYAENMQDSDSIEIHIAPGMYFERVVITSDNIHLVGAGQKTTFIQYDLNAQQGKAYHRDGWGTPGSATLTVHGKNVSVAHLTIENTFDFISNDGKPKDDPSRVRASQGVAVLLDESSDKVRFDHVAMLGYQDTFFANGGRAHITDSVIAGNVDFIFGRGQVLIEGSRIVSRGRGKAMSESELTGYVTAASTDLSQPYGLVFLNSSLEKEEEVPDRSVTLGRPWHPTTNFPDGRYADPNAVAQVTFVRCFMGNHIHPDRWSSMRGTAPDGTKSLVFTPADSRFFEYQSYGPGAELVEQRERTGAELDAETLQQLKREWRTKVLGAWQQAL